MSDIDDIWPIGRIFERNTKKLEDMGFSLRQLTNYAAPPRCNRIGFPEPVKTLSRYKFYSEQDVIEWCELWSRANRGGHPDHMSSGRDKVNEARANGTAKPSRGERRGTRTDSNGR